MKIRTLAAGGVLAVAAVLGGNEAIFQMERSAAVAEFHQVPMVEAAKRQTGQEIKSLRTATSETFKADSALVIRPDGTMVKQARFQSRVYTGPKYWKDADADTLRPLDLTVRSVSALARLNPLRTHDKYVDAGPYTARWMNDTPGNFRIETGGLALEYRAIYDPKGITVSTEATASGMKETLTLANADAAHTLRWLVETDGSLVPQADNSLLVRAKDGAVPLRIERPKSWDAAGKPVMVVASVAGDTLTFRVTVLPGQKYPVTVDPTTQITGQIGLSGDALQITTTTVYLTVRNAAGDYSSGSPFVGQFYTDPNYRVYRSFFCFPGITSSMASVSACTLYVDGDADYTDTDFNVNVVGARAWKSVLAADDYTHFNGWAASGTYTGTILNDTWSTSSYSAAWNALIFNAAGRDSLFAAKGDSLWVAMISSRDYTPTAPTGQEHLLFTGGTSPYISYTWTPPSINPPTNFQAQPITGARDSLLLSWTVNYSSSIDSLVLYRWPDSLRVATITKTASSYRIGGLNPYTMYRYYVRADSSAKYGYSDPDSCWTTQTFKTENFSLLFPGVTNRVAIAIYDSARSSKAADSIETANTGYLGQWKNAANANWHTIYRHTQTVKLPAMMKVLAESLFIAGAIDSSRTDFSLTAFSTPQNKGPTNQTANFYSFWGYQNGMAAYTGTALVNSYSTSGFTTGGTLNKLVFTQAGRDTTIKRAATDSLRFVLLSSKDVSATAPTQAEYVTITPASSYIRLTYAPPDSVPGAVTITSISSDSLLVSWQDRSYSEYGYAVQKSDGTDLNNTELATGGTTTANGGATPEKAFDESLAAGSFWEYGAVYPHWLKYDFGAGVSKIVTRYRTRLYAGGVGYYDRMPNTWTFEASNDTTGAWTTLDWVSNKVFTDGETYSRFFPNSTAYRYYRFNMTVGNASNVIRICEVDFFFVPVAAAGATSLRVGGLSPNTEYYWKLRVIGGSLHNSYSAADSCYTRAAIPGKPTVTFPADSLLKFILNVNSNPSYTEMAVQDSVTGKYIDGRFNRFFTTTAAESILWRTYAAWGNSLGDTVAVGVGKKIVVRVKAKSGQ